MQTEITSRQREILRNVVEEYVASGQPVGSKHLVERGSMSVSSSTVRYELAELETLGLLTHPHTSAGRVPTERGYRFYVDTLLERLEPRPGPFELDLSLVRSEVEGALQATTEMLAQVTSLLALVSAPLLEVLEKRAALLEIVGEALDPKRPFVRVGGELENPALHDVALVGASYGLTHRTLGAVGLLGPVRMDYDKAIRSVRAAAFELSRFVEEIYAEN